MSTLAERDEEWRRAYFDAGFLDFPETIQAEPCGNGGPFVCVALGAFSGSITTAAIMAGLHLAGWLWA